MHLKTETVISYLDDIKMKLIGVGIDELDIIKSEFFELKRQHEADNSNQIILSKMFEVGQEYLRLTKIYLNIDITEINQLISSYNSTSDKVAKFEILKKIYQKKNLIEAKYPPEYINAHEEYRELISIKLFKELKQQFALFGVSLFSEDIIKATPATILTPNRTPLTEDDSFPKLLANMNPDKLARMLEILLACRYDLNSLNIIYLDEDSPEAKAFRKFTDTHSICLISNGNVKNFKITEVATGKAFILKLDERLNQPRDIDRYLREHGLNDVLTDVPVERQVTYADKRTGKTVTSTLLITEYYPAGNLENHAKKFPDNEDRITAAINIYSRMLEILIKFQSVGCVFPDMKNSNWLVDQDENIHIADTKSFIYSNFKIAEGKNLWRSHILATPYIQPYEIKLVTNLSTVFVDKMHAFMFGKNLYQYLTQCSDDYLKEKEDANIIDFSADIFSTKRGEFLKELISNLIRFEPDRRIDLSAALSQLRKVPFAPLVENINQLLIIIESHQLGFSDIAMQTFVDEKKHNLILAVTEEQLKALEAELIATLSEVQKPSAAKAMLTEIESIRAEGPLSDRALAIKQAIYLIPITERLSESPAILAVKGEIKLLKEAIECDKVLNKIESLGLFSQEYEMSEFIKQKKQEIYAAKSPELLSSIKGYLKEIHARLEDSEFKQETFKKVRGLIDKFEKAILIINEMRITPIIDRHPSSKANIDLQNSLEDLDYIMNASAKCSSRLRALELVCYKPYNKGVMSTFIDGKKSIFKMVSSKAHMIKIEKEIDDIYNNLEETERDMQKIQDIIDGFRQKSLHWFTFEWFTFQWVSLNAKADRIERALHNLPIKDRHDFLNKTSFAAMELKKALAYRRLNWDFRQGSEIAKDGSINEANAASSYKFFSNYIRTSRKNIDPVAPAFRS